MSIILKKIILKIMNMKNISNLILLLFVLIFSSCDKGESIENLENQTLTFDEFFEKVSSMDIQTSKENAIFINYTWNKQNNSITIISSEEKEASLGTALKVASLKNDSNFQTRSSGDKYQVSCSNGGESWNKECSGKWSCGGLIAECLDAGGCAEICKMKMEYYAPEKIFFLDADDIISSDQLPIN